jgi:hypothetical protein
LRHFVLTAALAFAACTPGAETPAEPASTPAAGTAQPTSSGEALTADGWTTLKIGMARADLVGAVGDNSIPDGVGGPDPDSCDEFHPAKAPEGLFVMLEGKKLSRITITELSKLKTADGFGIGDDPAAIKAFYGARAAASPHQYQDKPAEYITVWQTSPARDYDPAARGFVYEVDGTGKVGAIHAGGASIQYVEGCL